VNVEPCISQKPLRGWACVSWTGSWLSVAAWANRLVPGYTAGLVVLAIVQGGEFGLFLRSGPEGMCHYTGHAQAE
jgi:hypothetical protein